MANRDEIRDFLSSRRAKITPQQAGLPAYGGRRRVPGLRREEVALLAGVSVDYYTRLERGDLKGVSRSVLDAIASALHLDEPERTHLNNLALAANSAQRVRRRPPQDGVRSTIQRILDAMTSAPAYVRNGRRDILAANKLGYALYSELYLDPARPVNVARFVSSTGEPVPSSSTGRPLRTTSSLLCAPRSAKIPTTVSFPTSSANFPAGATNSPLDGPRRTCASIAAASKTSTIRSSVISI